MTATLKRILVPMAFSDNCLAAKTYAAELARAFGAEVTLLHVVEGSPYEVYQQKGISENVPLFEYPGTSMPASQPRFFIKDVMDDARNELERMAADGSGLAYRLEVRHGHTSEQILEEIADYKPDLVVMATMQRHGLQHMLLGSVTERVVRLSPVPVLTLPNPQQHKAA